MLSDHPAPVKHESSTMSKGGHTDLLRQFGLARNPFVDRTAEKTSLDPLSLYVHSDLHGFTPSGARCGGAW